MMNHNCWKLLLCTFLTVGLLPAGVHAEEEQPEEDVPYPLVSIETNLAVERDVPAIGVAAPNFVLPNPGGEEVDFQDLRMAVPTLLVFYTGGWNPWCWNQLLEYGQKLDEIMENGIQLVAVSPENPSQQIRTQEELDLQFEMLWDRDSQVAREYGLGWQFQPSDWEVWRPRIQRDRGVDLGEVPPLLPVPALFLIDTNGIVQWSSLSPDWEERPGPEEIARGVAEWRQRIQEPIPERFLQ